MSDLIHVSLLPRLGATIFHALWQLTALGLLAWAGLALLRSASPRTRYAWACACLLAMVVVPVLTLMWLGAPPETVMADIQVDAVTAGQTDMLHRSGSWLASLSPYLPWLALAWAMGVALMGLRLAGSLYWLDRTFIRGGQEAPPALTRDLAAMAARFGLDRTPSLRLSPCADTPMVIGCWRTVVILPASALLHLEPQALEAVLAHELAHIRRRDPLVNLLQSVAEALLFFHPAAWWLSRQIRELREVCCDDDAVALTGDPMPLARGLAALEALRLHPITPEPALAAAKGSLMSRIHRLFRPSDLTLPDHRGLGLAALLLLGGLVVAQEAKATKKPKPKPKAATTAPATTDAPEASSKPDRIVDVDFSQIKVRHKPKPPAYPAQAKIEKVQGIVVVEILVGTDGVPTSAKAVSGPDLLRAASEQYAMAWRFEPALSKGKPVAARLRLTMPYKLVGSDTPKSQESQPSRTSSDPAHSDKEAMGTTFANMKVVHKPAPPSYPAIAKINMVQGTVVVEMVVDTEGNVVSAKAIEGPEPLHEAAVNYAKQWRFKPAEQDGKPVNARFRLTMPFKLV